MSGCPGGSTYGVPMTAPALDDDRVILRRAPRLAPKARLSLLPTLTEVFPRWHRLANCAGLANQVFFGHDEVKPMTSAEIGAARAVCASCPVRRTCLVYALEGNEHFGVWGGYARMERQRMLEQWGYDTPADIRDPSEAPSAQTALPHILAAYDAGTLDAAVVRLR